MDGYGNKMKQEYLTLSIKNDDLFGTCVCFLKILNNSLDMRTIVV